MRIKTCTQIIGVLFLLVMLSACNMPSRVDPTATLNSETQVALTLTANALISQTPSTTPETVTTATYTPSPTATLPSTPTQTSTPEPPTTTPIPCNLAQFVKDVTVPDGTEFEPGQDYTKTWRLKNIGSCPWTSAYDMIFSSGDSMGGPAAVQLTSGTVPSGGTVDVSVNLVAPDDEGTYRGNWKLRDGEDQVFGISSTSSGEFWVEIKVVEVEEMDFSASFNAVEYCGIEPAVPWFIEITVTNTGAFPFLSFQTTVEDTVTGKSATADSNTFTDWKGCVADIQQSDLASGESGVVSSGLLGDDPEGHKINATIKLCTENDLGGNCITKSISFTP